MPAEMRSLVEAARAGDKLAQLELGERFEEGRGVAVDLARARKLYAAAAADSGGRIWVYSPPVPGGGSGRAIPVERGPAQPGLAEAARRLAALRSGPARR
jgi:hypothetical protein